MPTISPWMASMAGRFWRPARSPLRAASAMWRSTAFESGLKGFSAPAGLLGVRVGDPETGAGQAILVVDDGTGEVNQAAFLDEKRNAVGGEGFITRLAGRNFHGVRHAGATACRDIDG